MSKIFLKLGMDHGTTNSSIAVMESDGPRVIKVDGVDETMPSAVYIDRHGRTFVGSSAYRSIAMNKNEKEGNGYSKYKLQIGQDNEYEFRAAHKTMTAPALGGLVLGALLRAYRDESGEEPVGAVITVPALFEHSACEGTRKAAQLAGLKHYPLIAEPIAASLAYGFTAKDRRAQWMVYDLGGGTLDVSLVFVRDGLMDVPEEGHAGDNRLGGSFFDREILAYVLDQLGKQYALADFAMKHGHAYGRLLIACEQAKIRLSMKTEATIEIEGVLCKDDRGADVSVSVPITRDQYEAMIAPEIEKTILICKNLLKANRLSPKDLDTFILVGGPTKTPYISKRLSEALDIEVKHTIDTMSAVAVGAAIHAATIELPAHLHQGAEVPPKPIEAGFVTVQLEYERTPRATPCTVAGRVQGLVDSCVGMRVEIKRSDGWSSGDIPVAGDGTFVCDVALIDDGKPKKSSFVTRVFNSAGEMIASVAEPEILYPYSEVGGRLANSLLIATEDKRAVLLIPKGSGLPCKGKGRFVTTKPLKMGSGDEVLCIPVLEGVMNLFGVENSDPDCSVHIGSLIIRGKDLNLPHDLPVGSNIIVTLNANESREVTAQAYIELVNDYADGKIEGEGFQVAVKDVIKRFDEAKAILDEARTVHSQYPTEGLSERLKIIVDVRAVEDIEKEIERAKKGEMNALPRAHRRVLELIGSLRMIGEAQLEARIRQSIDQLQKAVRDYEIKDLDAIKEEWKQISAHKDAKGMKKILEMLHDLDGRVRKRPYFEVLLDLQATSNMSVTPVQHKVFTDSEEIVDRIAKKGGIEALSAQDLAELEKLHARFIELYPDLFERRDKVIEDMKNASKDGTWKIIPSSDVKQADSGRIM